jgi:hypothetical protein
MINIILDTLLYLVPFCGIMFDMGKKHYQTFEAILLKPDRRDILWDDFLALLRYLGAIIKEQSGSAVGIRLNGKYAVFHKPHPGHEMYPSDLKRIRRFLEEAGINKVE